METRPEGREARIQRMARAIEGAGLVRLVEEMAPLDYLLSTRRPEVQAGLAAGGHIWSVYQQLMNRCRHIAAAAHEPDEDIDALSRWLMLNLKDLIRAVLGDWAPYERRSDG